MSRDVLAFLNSFLVAPPPLPLLATIDFVVAATSVAPLLLIREELGETAPSIVAQQIDRSQQTNQKEQERRPSP